MKDWKPLAIQEGRICPECKQPVGKSNWKDMQTEKGLRSCWNCRYAHWQIPINNEHSGNVESDNADREAFAYIREGCL